MMDISQYLSLVTPDEKSGQDGFEVWMIIIVLLGSLLAVRISIQN